MFGIGGFEFFLILIFAFLIFGPDKLPEIGRTVGRAIAKFREAQQEVNDTLGNEKIFDPSNPDEPFKDPIEALDRLAQRQEDKKKAKEAGGSADGKPAGSAAKAGDAPGDAGADADAPRKESFTERKARYERERAARKAAEAAAAQDEGKGDAAEGDAAGEPAPSEPAAEGGEL